MSALVEASGLSYRVGGRALVDGAALTLEPGRITVAIGPNGAGKSTLLRMLTGELRPSTGTIRYDGVAVRDIPNWRLANKRAVLTQAGRLSFPFAVHEVVRIGVDGAGRGLGPQHRRAIVAESLAAADVGHLAPRLYQTLSGGEQQRVQFARVLAQLAAGRVVDERRVLFLDEPVSSLDLHHQFAVMDMARTVAAGGVAVFAILHDLNLAVSYADEVIVLDTGLVMARGAPDRILTESLLASVFRIDLRIERNVDGWPTLILPRRTTADRHRTSPRRWIGRLEPG